jgi:glucose/arabinose dehydrogenase
MRAVAVGVGVIAAGVVLAGCTAAPQATPEMAQPLGAAPSLSVTGVHADGFSAPWGLVLLGEGSSLVSERDSATVWRVSANGERALVGTFPDVTPDGEGGLLGIAVSPNSPDTLYAYVTTAQDNRVLRATLGPDGLFDIQPVIDGIPRASIHNGGRIAFGPDGMLYIATGDAGDPDLAQDPGNLGGKVLRVTPEGTVPADNPIPNSPVFTLGHRNVQGLAFDDEGRLWASEFGTNIADELNLLVPGGNYGWPIYEGIAGDSEFIDPVVQWSPTSLASPSGIAFVGGDYPAIYVASLRGEVLWEVPIVGDRAGEPRAVDLTLDTAANDSGTDHSGVGLGRLRTIDVASDGSLWIMTSNTDGRGQPRPGDDRIVQVLISAP